MKSGINVTARRLRLLLFVCILTIFGAGTVALTFTFQHLKAFNQQVNSLEANASVTNDDVVKLRQLKKNLADNGYVIYKTHRIVADSMSYRYQDEIINDITKYADQSGIQISGFSFTNNTGAAGGSSSTGTAAPTTPTTPATSGSSLPGGIKSVSATVSVTSPVNYSKYMKFIQFIETNATKMQIRSISLGRPADPNTPLTDIEPKDLEIEVYVR